MPKLFNWTIKRSGAGLRVDGYERVLTDVVPCRITGVTAIVSAKREIHVRKGDEVVATLLAGVF